MIFTLTVFRHDWTAVLRYSSVVSFASLHQHDGGIEISFVGELVMRLSAHCARVCSFTTDSVTGNKHDQKERKERETDIQSLLCTHTSLHVDQK